MDRQLSQEEAGHETRRMGAKHRCQAPFPGKQLQYSHYEWIWIPMSSLAIHRNLYISKNSYDLPWIPQNFYEFLGIRINYNEFLTILDYSYNF